MIAPSHLISVIDKINKLPENNTIPNKNSNPQVLNSLVAKNLPIEATKIIANA